MRNRLAIMIILSALLTACASPAPLPPPIPVQIEGATYYGPPGVQIRAWTATPDEIIWVEDGTPSHLKATPKRAGNRDLTAGARTLAQLPAGEISKLESTGHWIAYTVEQRTADLRQVSLYLVDIVEPAGSNLIASARLGLEGAFISALGPNHVVTQSYNPEGPAGRYRIGETQVHQMAPQESWSLSGVPWSVGLQIDGASLIAYPPDGTQSRHPLRAPATTGERLWAEGDLDGDGQSERILGRPETDLRVLRTDGTQMWSLATNGKALADWLPMTGAQVVHLGGPHPVLLLETQGGTGGVGLIALGWQTDHLAPLTWAGKPTAFGFPSYDPTTKSLIVRNRLMDYVHHSEYSAFTWQDGQMAIVDRWVGPRPEELSYPEDPTFLLLAAFTAVTLDLPEETPRYFADAATAARFHQQIQGMLPPSGSWGLDGSEVLQLSATGEARFVLRAYAPGAAAGARVSGTVNFLRQGERLVIESLALDPR